MVAHVEMPALDPTPGPATFSAPIVSGLLRRDLGFDGVIYTDSMLMDAVKAMVDPGEAAVTRAWKPAPTSCSIRSMPAQRPRGAEGGARQRPPRRGRASKQSVRRVLTHKARLGLHLARTVDLDEVMAAVGTKRRRRHRAGRGRAGRDAGARRRDRRCRCPLPAHGRRPLPVGARLSGELAHRGAEPHGDPRAAQAMAVGHGRGAVRSLDRPRSWSWCGRWPPATTRW